VILATQVPFLLGLATSQRLPFSTLTCAVKCALTDSLYVRGLMFSLHQPRTFYYKPVELIQQQQNSKVTVSNYAQ